MCCVLAGNNNKAGITGLIEHIHLKQMIYTVSSLEDNWNTGESWLEAGMYNRSADRFGY